MIIRLLVQFFSCRSLVRKFVCSCRFGSDFLYPSNQSATLYECRRLSQALSKQSFFFLLVIFSILPRLISGLFSFPLAWIGCVGLLSFLFVLLFVRVCMCVYVYVYGLLFFFCKWAILLRIWFLFELILRSFGCCSHWNWHGWHGWDDLTKFTWLVFLQWSNFLLFAVSWMSSPLTEQDKY